MHSIVGSISKAGLLTSAAALAMVPVHAAAQSALDTATVDSSEIIVTAQKRAERFEDVPISITAVTGEQVDKAGVTNLTEVGQMTVGVNFTNNGPQIQPTIRGITSLTGSIGQDNNVAIYIDGVYQGSSTTLNQELLDIESVQILKGPQGTLFGRNSTAGAILIKTLDPEFDISGKVRASYGRFNDYTLAGYLTAPIASDVLAFNLSGSYRESDGFNRDLFDRFDPAPLKNYSIRGKLLFQPSEDLKFILSGEYARVNAPWTTSYVVANRNTTAFENPGTVFATKPGTLSLDSPNHHETTRKAVTLTAEWDLGFATLKSISAFSDEQSMAEQDGDGTPIPRSFVSSQQDIKNYTQEFNLGGTTGRLDWVLGAFYLRQDNKNDTFLAVSAPDVDVLGPVLGPISYGARPRAWALFADGTYRLTDRLSVIAGLRYSWEKKTIVLPYPRTTTDPNDTTSSRGFLENNRASETWTDVTPRISLRYELADRTNVYASYTKGFKSGSYGSSLPTIANPNGGIPAFIAISNPVNPEKADAFEIGFKTAQPGWRFNFAAFYYDYKDLQVQTSSLLPPPAPPVLVTQLTNAASSEIYGLEFSGSVDVSDRLTISGALGWTHARYKKFTGAQAYGLCPVTEQTINGVTGFYDATGFVMFSSAGAICTDTSTVLRPQIPDGFNTRSTGLMDRSGDPLLRSPEWNANLIADYRAPTSIGEIGVNVAANYSSKYGLNDLTPVGPGNRFYRFAQPGFVMINAQLSLVPAFNENLKFTFWGRNLADEDIFISGLGNAGDRFVVGPPLTYGFQIDFAF
ncbi:MAG: TonB-dependent receptor [Novosphingobium sp.]|nr:TonB-dependent receptor [Novosphingobium sp.]